MAVLVAIKEMLCFVPHIILLSDAIKEINLKVKLNVELITGLHSTQEKLRMKSGNNKVLIFYSVDN